MLVALDHSLARRKQIVIAGPPDEFLKTLHQRFQPYAVTIVVNDAARLALLIPAIDQMKELDGLLPPPTSARILPVNCPRTTFQNSTNC